MSSSRKRDHSSPLAPVGWTGWDDDRVDLIRNRILRGEYNAPDVIDTVARRLLASGMV